MDHWTSDFNDKRDLYELAGRTLGFVALGFAVVLAAGAGLVWWVFR